MREFCDFTGTIVLGDYLDLLLSNDFVKRPSNDNDTKFMQYESLAYQSDHRDWGEAKYRGGIRLPRKNPDDAGTNGNDDGSGNIVIIGEPGVGKSTLAFQIAAECTSEINNGIAVYYSVDISRSQLMKSMCEDEESKRVNRLCSFPARDANDNADTLCAHFMDALIKDENGCVIPQILMPMLSPRGITADENEAHMLFRERFRELELMLRAIVEYNKTAAVKVKLVVIDSINMIGERPLTREQISRLFELFEHYGIIGLFTLAENTSQSSAEAINSTTVKYIADVVIQLRRELFNNYTCMTFEVVKSRYVKPIVGKHPYKIIAPRQARRIYGESAIEMRKCVVVLPSLHYLITGTERTIGNQDRAHGDTNLFGIKILNKVLPDNFATRKHNATQVVTLTGEGGQYKSDIAINALINGLLLDHPQNGLIIRLSDRDTFEMSGIRLEAETVERLKKHGFLEARGESSFVPFCQVPTEITENYVKRTINGWTLARHNDGVLTETRGKLFEIILRSGALLPEEFISDVLGIIRRHAIKRLVFTDIKYIGISYPFLVDSGTSGNLFISAFIHIMRNFGVDVIMTSSLSGFQASDEEVKKAKVLSDAIISCNMCESLDTTITGEGQMISKRRLGIHSSGISTDAISHDASKTEVQSAEILRNRCSFEFLKASGGAIAEVNSGDIVEEVGKSASLMPFEIVFDPGSKGKD